MGVLSGDGIVFCGMDVELEWVAGLLAETLLLNVVGKFGWWRTVWWCAGSVMPEPRARWVPEGLTVQAGPRHAELLAAMLGSSAPHPHAGSQGNLGGQWGARVKLRPPVRRQPV